MEKLAITGTVLDKLGFSEYWDEDGDWGGRTLTFQDGTRFRILELCERDDDTAGYGDGKYISNHYTFNGWFAIPAVKGDHDLFFLHEMYACIEKFYPDCLQEFVEKCHKLKMKVYIPK